jgi:SARP family transcriptional regulator, regulator of embCAB operon
MATLIIETGDHKGRHFRLAARPLVGGRAPAAEIQVVDSKVSRRHFLIAPEAGGYAIRELRSTNGIWVNGERVSGQRALADGDRIRVGDTELRFRVEDDPEQRDAVHEYRKFSPTLRDRGTVRG